MSSAQSLKEIGLKATLPRRKILELFEGSKVRHLSAEDVYKTLMSEGIDVGLATVYRVLTQCEQAGLLARQHFETGQAVIEPTSGGLYRVVVEAGAEEGRAWIVRDQVASAGTFGGGSGGGVPSKLFRIHFPRRTGEVRMAWEVSVSTLA